MFGGIYELDARSNLLSGNCLLDLVPYCGSSLENLYLAYVVLFFLRGGHGFGWCAGGVGQPPGPEGLANLVVPAGARVTRRRWPAGLRRRDLLATASRWTAASASTLAILMRPRWESQTRPGSRETLSSQGARQASWYH